MLMIKLNTLSSDKETVFHCYLECVRLVPQQGRFSPSKYSFLVFKYKKSAKHKCQLLNLILGQTKMAIYVSRKKKMDDSVDIDVKILLTRMVKARLMVDFNYYKEMKDLDQFTMIWAHVGKKQQLTFSVELM